MSTSRSFFTLFHVYALSFIAVAFFSVVALGLAPGNAYAAPSGDDCSGVTWQYEYRIETNPFPPDSAGYIAWYSLYGENRIVESSYQVATIGDMDGVCGSVEYTNPTAGIVAVPSIISSGGSSYLSWSSTYATSCTGTNFSTGGATSGSIIVSPSSSITYSVTCTDGVLSAAASAIVAVSAPVVAPTATLSVSPASITAGASSVLTWSSTNATTCTGTNFGASSATAGSVTVIPSQTTSYLVSCTGAGGSASASQTITVTTPASPTPTVTLIASPSSIISGSSSTLTWNSTNAVFCNGTGFDTSGLTAGSITVSPSATASYSIVCAGTGQTTTGTWQYSYSDVSDFTCPLTDPNRAYTGVSACPTNPAGKACSTSICRVNTISSCNILTDVYTCSASSPAPSAGVSTTVTVLSPIAGSCSAAPSSVYVGSPVTWTVSPSGGTGSYAYSWSGTDGLSGTGTSISKVYTSPGTKTGVVTITSGGSSQSVSCSGPVTVAYPPISGSCAVSPTSIYAGRSAIWTVSPSGGTGAYSYAWSGTDGLSGTSASVSKTYTKSGVKTGSVAVTSGASSKTISCSNLAVSVVLSDLTAGIVSPSTAVAGIAKIFSSTITNAGQPATGGSFVNLFQRATSASGTNATDIGTDSSPNISANGSDVTTLSYTFPSGGTWYLRACVDKSSASDPGRISESNENNNCSAWTAISVSNPPLSASCGVSPSSGYVGDTFTWVATPSGGTGSYTYSWSGTDSLSGTSASVSKVYSTAGLKTGTVTVTSGSETVTRECSNSATLSALPTVVITATPTEIIRGGSASITWTATNATTCTGTNFSTGGATSGSVNVSPTATTTYTVTCLNSTRGAVSTATVTVYIADLTLTVSPALTVRKGDLVTVVWSVAGTPDSCTMQGPGLSSTAFSGSRQVVVSQESVYTLTCRAGSTSASKKVTVKLIPAFEEF